MGAGLGEGHNTDRLDISGARWGLDGAEAVLKLRTVTVNGHLDACWKDQSLGNINAATQPVTRKVTPSLHDDGGHGTVLPPRATPSGDQEKMLVA
ncbi:hypothetical protein [Saccharopolyspora pogona]|uniref:hypothetical protein n=1 Tax=Saccharopolyspora pogona TaxID=333966 RepID=UPI0016855F28|nr:hypothetical protein [Saccharopolyspora pogona]